MVAEGILDHRAISRFATYHNKFLSLVVGCSRLGLPIIVPTRGRATLAQIGMSGLLNQIDRIVDQGLGYIEPDSNNIVPTGRLLQMLNATFPPTNQT
jgi:hypothetical protein